MLAQRIRTGLHRIGMALAVICLAIGVAMIAGAALVRLFLALTGLAELARPSWEASRQLLLVGSACLPVAAVAYGIPWIIGRIIARFGGGGEKTG
jgi:hypothetical protein